MKSWGKIIIAAALMAPGAGLAGEPALGPIPAQVLRVIDGDTLEVAARIWIGQTVTIRVRLKDIDAPELDSPCREGRTKAQAARELVQRIAGGGPVTLNAVRPGKYAGRVLAEVTTAEGVNLGQALLEARLARPYRGGKRGGWC